MDLVRERRRVIGTCTRRPVRTIRTIKDWGNSLHEATLLVLSDGRIDFNLDFLTTACSSPVESVLIAESQWQILWDLVKLYETDSPISTSMLHATFAVVALHFACCSPTMLNMPCGFLEVCPADLA